MKDDQVEDENHNDNVLPANCSGHFDDNLNDSSTVADSSIGVTLDGYSSLQLNGSWTCSYVSHFTEPVWASG